MVHTHQNPLLFIRYVRIFRSHLFRGPRPLRLSVDSPTAYVFNTLVKMVLSGRRLSSALLVKPGYHVHASSIQCFVDAPRLMNGIWEVNGKQVPR